MKKISILVAVAAGFMLLAVAAPTFAAEQGKGKEITVKGDAKCAKCMLKESDKCQTVIQTEGKNGKQVTYYLADNSVAKDFHENVCKGSKKVTAIGTVKKVNGKQEFAATKIELAK
jgi:spermidine/putrescine-binding protein